MPTTMRKSLAFALSTFVLCARAALAQSSVIVGRVVDDASEQPIPGAQVSVRGDTVVLRADPTGTFRYAKLREGTYVLVIRAVGYDTLVATVRLAANDTVVADLLMARTAQVLSKVAVDADGGIARLRLAEFEERRRLGFGKFLNKSVFEAGDASNVDGLIVGRIPGIRTNRVAGKLVLTAQREAKACYPQVVVNGISMFNGVPKGPPGSAADMVRARETLLFDLLSLQAKEIIGFEWHNPSTTPLRYNATGAGNDGAACGTAIFWTK